MGYLPYQLVSRISSINSKTLFLGGFDIGGIPLGSHDKDILGLSKGLGEWNSPDAFSGVFGGPL